MDTSTSGAVDQARSAASDLADQAKDTASSLADQARSAAEGKLATGKEQATGALASVTEALHATGDALRDRNQDAFARYADMAAREVEQFTGAIRGRSVGELLDEAEGFARREPALFLGGAFLLGIFGSRFLKAGTDASTGASTRGLLSEMRLPGSTEVRSTDGHDHVTNVNRPPNTDYGRDLMQGHAGASSARASSAHASATGPSMPAVMSGGNLLAGNAAAGADPS